MNSIDLCAIVPYFITLATVLTENKDKEDVRVLKVGAGQEKGASLGTVSRASRRTIQPMIPGIHAAWS